MSVALFKLIGVWRMRVRVSVDAGHKEHKVTVAKRNAKCGVWTGTWRVVVGMDGCGDGLKLCHGLHGCV